MKLANNLVKAAGFKSISDSSFIKKCDINTNIDKKILDQLKNEYNYLVKCKIEEGITSTQDLLTLIRRVLRTHEKSIFYKRFNDKGKTSYLFKII
jgi:hypothetical protein